MARRDHRTAALTEVRDAYDSWAADYTDLFGSADKASTEDRAVITAWAETVSGPVLDAGCGPGHWSAFLHTLGLQVEGVDATPAFVQHAAQTYPEIPFHLGDLRSLELAPASLGGVLAWFSLIHLDPAEVPQALRTFSAALRPDGKLLVGYFTGPDLQPFDHRVVTAWASLLVRRTDRMMLRVRAGWCRPVVDLGQSPQEVASTERLVLAPPTAADIDECFAIATDPRLWRHCPSGRPTRRADTVATLQRIADEWHQVGLGAWAVRRTGQQPVIGYGGCSLRRNTFWNLSYRLAAESHSEGLATELAIEAVRQAHQIRPSPPYSPSFSSTIEPLPPSPRRSG